MGEIRGPARGRINSAVRPLLWDRRLTRKQKSFSEKPQPQRADSGSSDEAPPQQHQAPQQHNRPPDSHAPAQSGPPKQKPAHSIPDIFHYSRCTGRKKAVCVCVSSVSHRTVERSLTPNAASLQVGINYTGSSKPLNGCVNDAHNIRQFLISGFTRTS